MESKIDVEELMSLYEELPNLVLYKNDLVAFEKSKYIAEIVESEENENLNPLGVVLESLINVLSEKLSTDALTQSRTTVLVDKSMQELAVQKVVGFIRKNPSALETMHKRWLNGLRNFISDLKEKGVQTLQEVLFQVSLKFRISASSSMEAIATLMR